MFVNYVISVRLGMFPTIRFWKHNFFPLLGDKVSARARGIFQKRRSDYGRDISFVLLAPHMAICDHGHNCHLDKTKGALSIFNSSGGLSRRFTLAISNGM